MKPKTVVLMVVAIGFGLVAAYLTSRIGAGPAAPETVDVLVADKKIDRGTKIADPDKMFKTKPFIKGQEPKLAIQKTADLKDKIVNKTISPDAFVTPDDLTADSGPKLEKGQRAYAIRVDQEKTAGGFVMPNKRVDVIHSGERRDGKGTEARIILQNMLVLAADSLLAAEEGKSTRIPITVTLAVTPAQVQILAAAKHEGILSLALRANDDNSVAKTGDAEEAKDDIIDVWVAKQDIPANTELTENLLTKKSFIKGQQPQKAIKSLKDLTGKTVNRMIIAEQFITEEDVKVIATVKTSKDPATKTQKVKVHTLIIYNGPKAEGYEYRTVDGVAQRVRKARDESASDTSPDSGDGPSEGK